MSGASRAICFLIVQAFFFGLTDQADGPGVAAVAAAAGESTETKPDYTKEPYPKEYYVAITGRVEKVERIRGAGNREPWWVAKSSYFDKTCLAGCRKEGPYCWHECAREDKSRADQSMVSNSCGYRRTGYDAALLARADAGILTFQKVSPFITWGTLGEFCKLSLSDFYWDTGFLLRKWGGSFYEEFFLDGVFRTAERQYLVSPFSFWAEERERIRDMFVPLKSEETFCFVADFLTLEKAEEMKSSPLARPEQEDGEDMLCLTQALPLSLVLSAYKRLYPHRFEDQ